MTLREQFLSQLPVNLVTLEEKSPSGTSTSLQQPSLCASVAGHCSRHCSRHWGNSPECRARTAPDPSLMGTRQASAWP